MVVLFLTVMVAMILLRALRKDIAQYNEASYLEGISIYLSLSLLCFDCCTHWLILLFLLLHYLIY